MEIKVNDKLELVNYLILVEAIAKGFFNETDNSYQPHIGKLNAMRLFYNNCLEDCECTEKYGTEIDDVNILAEILRDTDFADIFYKSIRIDDNKSQVFDFGLAYWDAWSIIDYKKSSIGTVVDTIALMFNQLADKLGSLLTKDKIDTISNLLNEMADGKLTPDSVLTSYMNKLAQAEVTEQEVAKVD